jgi:aspartate carbamoyltransferase
MISDQQHLVSVADISRLQLIDYFETAERMRPRTMRRSRQIRPTQYPNKILVTMFCEPSTRTSCSFQAAAIKLGCKVISITDKMSSTEKGESLEDTIRTLQYYGDAIVLRHPMKGAALRAAAVSIVPIINAGDGNGEHPTQALLDAFTIYSEFESRFEIEFDSEDRDIITIAFAGDLKNSRTIHSLVRLLTHFPKLRFLYVSPPELEMPEDVVNYVGAFNTYDQCKVADVKEAIKTADVLYMTRIQKERFESESAYLTAMSHSELYSVTPEIMELAKPQMMLMHPLPRLNEIPVEIDADERAVYFKQVENGLYMRMAILDKIFRTTE